MAIMRKTLVLLLIATITSSCIYLVFCFRMNLNLTTLDSSVTPAPCYFNVSGKGNNMLLGKEIPITTRFPLEVGYGGTWMPRECIPRQKVAILVPYRDRKKHLKTFLSYMHKFLPRQQISYTIYIIEQDPGAPFNRGMLVNIGFSVVSARSTYDCFIVHDVDSLPEDDRIDYTCTDQPRHLSVAQSKYGYNMPYRLYFGGVVAFTAEQFSNVNGFSNGYFGWGREDDDLYKRMKNRNYTVLRYPSSISRYRNLEHENARPSKTRDQYFKMWKKRAENDGLNSLEYSLLEYSEKPLYTYLYVSINQTIVMKHVDALIQMM